MLDRVRIEVIRNALRLAAEEMGTAVVRASFSSIIQEMAEASACVLTANVTDFYGEGLLLPPVKLYDAGEPCTPVFRILEHNTRLPKNLLGDVQALVSGANVGAMRIAAVIDRFGADAVAEAVAHLHREVAPCAGATPTATSSSTSPRPEARPARGAAVPVVPLG